MFINSFVVGVFFTALYFAYQYFRKNYSSSVAVDMPLTNQEDPAAKETIKRVRKSFNEQKDQIQARAVKAHDANCFDVLNCVKSPCFVVEPDKIVSTSVVPVKTRKQRIKDLTQKQG